MTTFTGGFKEKTAQATTETWDFISSKFSARRQFEGPWANRFDFIEELAGEIQDVDGNTTFGTLAAYPDNPIAIIAKISVVGVGIGEHNDSTGQAKWERAIVTVDYSTVPTNDTGGQSSQEPADYAKMLGVQESGSMTPENYSLAGQDVKQADDNKRLHDKGPFNFPLPLGSISINYPKMIRPNFLLADLLAGAVNNTGFVSPSGRAFAAEQIRFDGYDYSLTINITLLPNGTTIVDPTRLWNVTWRFSYNFWGWNNRFVGGVWKRIIANPNNKPLYRSRNLLQIFFGVGNYGFARVDLDYIEEQLSRVQDLELAGQDSFLVLPDVLFNVRQRLIAMGFVNV